MLKKNLQSTDSFEVPADIPVPKSNTCCLQTPQVASCQFIKQNGLALYLFNTKNCCQIRHLADALICLCIIFSCQPYQNRSIAKKGGRKKGGKKHLCIFNYIPIYLSINFLSADFWINFFITLSALSAFGSSVTDPRVIMAILFPLFEYWHRVSTQINKTVYLF